MDQNKKNHFPIGFGVRQNIHHLYKYKMVLKSHCFPLGVESIQKRIVGPHGIVKNFNRGFSVRMSIISKKSVSAASILRDHSSTNRAKFAQEQKNKVNLHFITLALHTLFIPYKCSYCFILVLFQVRFSLNVTQNVSDVLASVEQNGNVIAYDEYICMLTTTALTDDTFRALIVECKECIPSLQPKYVRLVETLLSLSWMDRPQHVIDEYKAFVVELLVTHNKYTRFAVGKLVQCWIPDGECNLSCLRW